jgi:hypothetical protein
MERLAFGSAGDAPTLKSIHIALGLLFIGTW